MTHPSGLSVMPVLFGLVAGWAAPSFGDTFSACYALENGNEESRLVMVELHRICLSDRGEATLHGEGGFQYDLRVKATFHPSVYSCTTIDDRTQAFYAGRRVGLTDIGNTKTLNLKAA